MKTLRETIISACPEILDLKFGCELEREGSARKYKVIEDMTWGSNREEVWVNSVPFGSMDLPFTLNKQSIIDRNGEEWKILGCPIELHHVLRAIGEKAYPIEEFGVEVPIGIDATGEFRGLGFMDGVYLSVKWNLREPLENQDPPTIAFLEKLLVTE